MAPLAMMPLVARAARSCGWRTGEPQVGDNGLIKVEFACAAEGHGHGVLLMRGGSRTGTSLTVLAKDGAHEELAGRAEAMIATLFLLMRSRLGVPGTPPAIAAIGESRGSRLARNAPGSS